MSDLPERRIAFPEGFLWGTAAAAHQVEGGNWNSDWWAFEHAPGSPCREPSGDACDHYHRYADDFALLAKLGTKVHRFSIEWARIEPERGLFSTAALDHYARVLDSLEAHGLIAFPTLHHFSSPRWFAAEGGWVSETAVDRFRAYAEHVAKRLGRRLPFVGTINEPQNVALMGYFTGEGPPGARDPKLRVAATRNMIAAHAAATEALREHAPQAKVGLALSVPDLQAADEASRPLRDQIHHLMVGVYVDALRTGTIAGLVDRDDEEVAGLKDSHWVGINYYTRARIDAVRRVLPPPEGAEMSQAYEVYPEGFITALRLGASTGLPIYVTENGIATADDKQRIRFVARHLDAMRTAMDEGADVRGYMYWSALDSFEWGHGYACTYGLVACDRQTFARTPKPSASYFGEICRANALDPELTRSFLESPR